VTVSYARNRRKKMNARMKRFGLTREEAYAIVSWSRALQESPKRRP
jgi:hypothetical protein